MRERKWKRSEKGACFIAVLPPAQPACLGAQRETGAVAWHDCAQCNGTSEHAELRGMRASDWRTSAIHHRTAGLRRS